MTRRVNDDVIDYFHDVILTNFYANALHGSEYDVDKSVTLL